MMWADYYANGPTLPVAESLHSCIIEGTKVICNYMRCDYEEEFYNLDDAKIASEVHANREE